MAGNPVTDHKFDGNAIIPFAHGMGLISDEIFEVKIKNLVIIVFNDYFFLKKVYYL